MSSVASPGLATKATWICIVQQEGDQTDQDDENHHPRQESHGAMSRFDAGSRSFASAINMFRYQERARRSGFCSRNMTRTCVVAKIGSPERQIKPRNTLKLRSVSAGLDPRRLEDPEKFLADGLVADHEISLVEHVLAAVAIEGAKRRHSLPPENDARRQPTD